MDYLSYLQGRDNISYWQQPLTAQITTEYQGAVSTIQNISIFHNKRIDRDIEDIKKYYINIIQSIRMTEYHSLKRAQRLRQSGQISQDCFEQYKKDIEEFATSEEQEALHDHNTQISALQSRLHAV